MADEWDWSRIVFDHVKLWVRDAEASKSFYRTVLEPLGIPPLWERDDGAQFANLVVRGGEPSGPVHVAFVAESREQVDAFHRAGVEAGYEDNGAPGVREHYTARRRPVATTRRSCSTPTGTTSRPSAARSSRRAAGACP